MENTLERTAKPTIGRNDLRAKAATEAGHSRHENGTPGVAHRQKPTIVLVEVILKYFSAGIGLGSNSFRINS